jgi:hypothetical protein
MAQFPITFLYCATCDRNTPHKGVTVSYSNKLYQYKCLHCLGKEEEAKKTQLSFEFPPSLPPNYGC